jgi:hypothetical protein
MPILNNKLEELISKSESTMSLYRNGDMRSGQKTPVTFDAMRRAILQVKNELYRNEFNSSGQDLQAARQRFISAIRYEIDPAGVKLNDQDREFLQIAILELSHVQLGAGYETVTPVIASRTQPPRAAKKLKPGST